MLERLDNIRGIEWSAAFGLATDVQNGAFAGGNHVPLRLAYSSDWAALGLSNQLQSIGDVAYGSDLALEQLGLLEAVGSAMTNEGDTYAISGRIETPAHLEMLEPLLIAPQPMDEESPVAVLILVAERPELVAPVVEAAAGVLSVDDPTRVSIQTSEALASLRALVEGQLGQFGRALTFAIFGITGVLTSAILYCIVTLRRKDFGRRRALGATRGLIVVMLATQTGILAALGALIGIGTSLASLAAGGDPLPGPAYTVGIALLAVIIGILASLLPAVAAAKREPIRELRVP